MHFLLSELQYATANNDLHIIMIFIANLSYNANYQNNIVLAFECFILAAYIMGDSVYKL